MNSKQQKWTVITAFRLLLATGLLTGMLWAMPATPVQAAYAGAGYALDFDGSDDYGKVTTNNYKLN